MFCSAGFWPRSVGAPETLLIFGGVRRFAFGDQDAIVCARHAHVCLCGAAREASSGSPESVSVFP